MRYLVALLLAGLPASIVAQEKPSADDPKPRVEVTGCVKNSMLIETGLRGSGGGTNESSTRRWRLRGPKALMKQLKAARDQELTIVGTSNEPKSGLLIGQTKIGDARIYIGTNPSKTYSEPVPDLPTIDIESFKSTGDRCR